MALYVVQVPDPPPGTDWTAVVPGEYLYNITGITATLTTGGGAGSFVCPDSSGNTNTGTFQTPNPVQYVPTLLPSPGGTAVDLNVPPPPPGPPSVWVNLPAFRSDFSSDWTVECWLETTGGLCTLFGAVNTGTGAFLAVQAFTGAGPDTIAVISSTGEFDSDPVELSDGLPHFVGVGYDGVGQVDFFVDGAPLGVSLVAPPITLVGADYLAIGSSGVNTGFCQGTLDEWAIFPGRLGPGALAAHYVGAFASYAAYQAAVLADTPLGFYQFDQAVAGPRQVVLETANGAEPVELVPTGFALASSAGPYAYSWQPNLNSSTQTGDGAVTTIATPQLILPAGYTIGTRTLDLAATDQWSDIRVWWNSDLMDAQAGVNAYDYPPGAHLVYHRKVPQ